MEGDKAQEVDLNDLKKMMSSRSIVKVCSLIIIFLKNFRIIKRNLYEKFNKLNNLIIKSKLI